jgi:hypothetical protein
MCGVVVTILALVVPQALAVDPFVIDELITLVQETAFAIFEINILA